MFTLQPQVLLMQETPAGHECPQLPQWKKSFVRSLQIPLHDVSPGRQAQFPAWQVIPQPVHISPHWPQLKSSVRRSAQW
jgi:hypothetical protein